MPMIISGNVGPSAGWGGDGANIEMRQGKTGEMMVSEFMPRYSETAYRGQLFLASNQAGVALTASLGTTATGFILTNPAGSGKNLHVVEICMALTSAPAGVATIGIAANVNPVAAAVTHTTPLTIRPALLGSGATSAALVDSAATLPAAPVFIRAVGGGPVATGSITAPFIKDEVAGAIILAPGSAISTFCLTTAISVLTSMSWIELPV